MTGKDDAGENHDNDYYGGTIRFCIIIAGGKRSFNPPSRKNIMFVPTTRVASSNLNRVRRNPANNTEIKLILEWEKKNK